MLAKALLITILGFLLGVPAFAEDSSEPVFVIKEDQPSKVLLGPFTGTHRDESRSLSFPAVRNSTFQYHNSPMKHFSYTTDRIWIKLKVRNLEEHAMTRILEIEPGQVNVIFYRIRASNSEADLVTTEQMRAQSSLQYRNSIFRITLPPRADEEWYISFENHYALTIKPILYEPTVFQREIERDAMKFSIYAGMMLFAVLFSFFLYTQTKHSPFLFYSLTIASFHLLFFLSNFGMLNQVWKRWPWFGDRAIFFFIELSHIFGFYFFMTLSDFRKYLPRTFRWVQIFPAKSLFLLTLSLFYFNAHLVSISVASTALILIFFMTYGTYLSILGQRPAFYFVVSWGVAFVCNAVYAITLSFNISDIPPILDAFMGYQIPLVANIIECIFMSLAIGDQFRQYRASAQKEKEDLIRLQNDLEDAEAVQSAFFSERSLPDSIHLWAESQSAEKTGGDWYGYYFDKEAKRFYMGIVDVTGHGVRSALVTGAVHGTFYSLVPLLDSKGDTPQDRLQCLTQSLNRIVHDTGRKSELMATMALVEIDLREHKVYYTSLAHCPSLILRQDTSRLLHAKGSPLGLYEQVAVEVKSYSLEDSDIILLYTDGWLENHPPGEKPISFKRFSSELGKCQNLDDLQHTLHIIRNSGAVQTVEDDYTAIAIQYCLLQAVAPIDNGVTQLEKHGKAS